MPLTVVRDGVTIEVTDDELKPVLTAAEQAALDAAKEKLRPEVEQELLADPNGAFAKARRQADNAKKKAEGELATAKAQLDDLQKKLGDTAGMTPEELAKLKQDAADALEAKGKLETQISDLQTAHAHDVSLIDQGARAGKLGSIKRELQDRGVDLADADAVKTALADIKGEAPGWFTDAPPSPYRPNGGPTNPPKSGTPLTPEEAAKLPPDEYYRRVIKGEG